MSTISAIPEENLLETSPVAPKTSSSTSALSAPLQPAPAPDQQLTATLNVDPPPEWSQPAVTVVPTTTPQLLPASTVFATPQSITADTSLPVNPTLPIMSLYQTPVYSVPTPASSIYLASPSATSFGTTAGVLMPAMMMNPGLSATPNTANVPGESFEQKWARYQASKKQTNPFAEDIAKKYEIKL